MRVAITGSSGLIGRALVSSYEADGHTVHRVVRDRDRATGGNVYWSVQDGEIDPADLDGVDAVVNLAGKPIEPRHWNDAERAEFLESRTRGTRLLAEALAACDDPPGVLVSQSASGYYGSRGDEVLTEDSAPGTGFMADVCVQWEAAADPARDAGLRVVHSRTGVVMAEGGPLIDTVRLPFRLGVGGRVGSGRQWVPWISLDDEVRAIRFLVDRDDLAGPVNVCSPNPVRNAELTSALGEAWHRPTLLPVPPFAVGLLFGRMGRMLATDSQRMDPAVLREAGFAWQDPELRPTLRRVLGDDAAA